MEKRPAEVLPPILEAAWFNKPELLKNLAAQTVPKVIKLPPEVILYRRPPCL